ncbi:acyl-CoA dehydrogenase [Thermotomaculum hydrothermale]|uniref:Acyl-CoA dehydrogenase n=1 Tax=Thermotomaculum hydrothermale TaxID=981385 RepID=A0A7R6PJC5_9BACT|nr:acyl-CoA dehydrogenase family protein [Thermotomaculum hydrothermale]BBB33624.1 acyl-CoA dehydrogenase [Thermotomaculum hydrothermale]
MSYLELNIDLTEEQEVLKKEVHKFAVEVLRPAAIKLDKMTPEEVIAENSIYWDVMKKMYELGYHTVHTPDEYGGMALDPISQHIFWEELAYGSVGFAVSLGVSLFAPFMASMLADDFIVEKIIKPFASCKDASIVGCWAITEPNHGSDTLTPGMEHFRNPDVIQEVKAVKKGDRWVLNGQKSAWVSNGPIATQALLFVNIDKSMGMAGGGICICDLTQKGVQKGKPLDKLGQRELPQGEIYFEDAEVPEELMIVDPESYEVMTEIVIAEANMHMGAFFTGLAQAAYDLALQYATERKQGGRYLIEHQDIKKKLFHMFTKVETARAYSRAVMNYNLNFAPPVAKFSLSSKVYCTQAAFEVCNDAIQIFGGYGLTKEYEIEKLFRDARAGLIEDGSNDTLAISGGNMIAKEVF